MALSKGGECPMPESCESVPLLQAILRLEPMSPNPLMLSELDKRLARVILFVLKLAKPLVSLLRILLTWSRFPLDELKGELSPPEVENRSLSPLLPV